MHLYRWLVIQMFLKHCYCQHSADHFKKKKSSQDSFYFGTSKILTMRHAETTRASCMFFFSFEGEANKIPSIKASRCNHTEKRTREETAPTSKRTKRTSSSSLTVVKENIHTRRQRTFVFHR